MVGYSGPMTEPHKGPIWTVGHSNHDIDAFLALLERSGIERIADVRRFPGSRRLPHFGADALRETLAGHGIGYAHLPALGGRRGRPAADSPNTGWRVAQFAAYADYMQSGAFRQGLRELERIASERHTAMMCAEALPWRCHRRLVADALIVEGWAVRDIMGRGREEPRSLTDFARLQDGVLVYP